MIFLTLFLSIQALASPIDDSSSARPSKFDKDLAKSTSRISYLPVSVQGGITWLASFQFFYPPSNDDLFAFYSMVSSIESSPLAIKSLDSIMKKFPELSFDFVHSETGMSPLAASICVGNKELVRYTLDSGAIPNIRVSSNDELNGMSPLELAILKDQEEIAEMLLDSPGLSVERLNPITGLRPLALALSNRSGNLEIANLILDHPDFKIDLHADHYLLKAIEYASLDGFKMVVQRAAEKVDLKYVTLTSSILNFAIKRNKIEIADLLVSKYGFSVPDSLFSINIEIADFSVSKYGFSVSDSLFALLQRESGNIWEMMTPEMRQWVLKHVAQGLDEAVTARFGANDPMKPIDRLCYICNCHASNKFQVLQEKRARVHDACLVESFTQEILREAVEDAHHYAISKMKEMASNDTDSVIDSDQVYRDKFMDFLENQ